MDKCFPYHGGCVNLASKWAELCDTQYGFGAFQQTTQSAWRNYRKRECDTGIGCANNILELQWLFAVCENWTSKAGLRDRSPICQWSFGWLKYSTALCFFNVRWCWGDCSLVDRMEKTKTTLKELLDKKSLDGPVENNVRFLWDTSNADLSLEPLGWQKKGENIFLHNFVCYYGCSSNTELTCF